MRIAFVTQHAPSEFVGGVEVVVLAHALALVARGHEVEIVAGSDRPHAGDDVIGSSLAGLRTHVLPRKPDEAYDLELERPRLTALVADLARSFDVVHVHHWSTLSSDLVRTLAQSSVVAVTLHDLFATCPRFFRASPVEGVECPPRGAFEPCVRCVSQDAGGLERAELAGRLVARQSHFDRELAHARAVISPSEFLARRARELVGLERIRVIPHGLCRALKPIAPTRRMPSGPLRVLHFGNLSRAKGTLDLVAALAALPRGAAELVLAGPLLEPDLAAAIERARGSLPVEVAGEYRERELVALANRCDLAVFPSRLDESYGLVVDEARALGLRVWVAARGALPERLGPLDRAIDDLVPPDRAAGDVRDRALADERRARVWTAAFLELLSRPSMFWEPGFVEAFAAPVRTALDAAAELEAAYLEAGS